MARENFANFALTALVLPNPLTSSGTSFTVTASQGMLFPTTNFLVSIDTEVMVITSRSGDTFTIGARGFDGTVAASHTVGASIQHSVSSYNFTHLWQNVADTPNPLVPPVQLGNTPSQWDNEFENAGSWIYYPSPPGGSTFSAGGVIRSHLLLDLGVGDNANYFAYVPFNPSSGLSWMATTKVSSALNFLRSFNTNDQNYFMFVASDTTNPVATFSNFFGVRSILSAQTGTNTTGSTGNGGYTLPWDNIVTSIQSGNPFQGIGLTLSYACPLYFRLFYDGAGSFTSLVGDGITFTAVAAVHGVFSLTQTLSLFWSSYRPSGSWFGGTWAVDYVRVVLGATNPHFG